MERSLGREGVLWSVKGDRGRGFSSLVGKERRNYWVIAEAGNERSDPKRSFD